MSTDFLEMPDKEGYFGEYGGQLLPPELIEIMNQIDRSYEKLIRTEAFKTELQQLRLNLILSFGFQLLQLKNLKMQYAQTE